MTTARYSRVQLFENRAVRTVRRAGVDAELGIALLPIFTITGGPVRVDEIIGVVTGPVGGIVGAALPLLSYVGDAAFGGVTTAMCILSATLAGDLPGTIYYWNGAPATAVLSVLRPTAALGIQNPQEGTWSNVVEAASVSSVGHFNLLPGVIQLDNTGGAAITAGVIDWYISYIPWISTSLIVAA